MRTAFQSIVQRAREALDRGFAKTRVDGMVEEQLVGMGWKGYEARGEKGPPAADRIDDAIGERSGKIGWKCRVSDKQLYDSVLGSRHTLSLKEHLEQELGREYTVQVTRDITARAIEIKVERLIPIN